MRVMSIGFLSDSEALLDTTFLESFRSEWVTSGADALTAGYRFIHLDTLPQQLDAAAALLTLWPGLAVLRRFGKLRLTLGACTAFHCRDLDSIGGFAGLNRDLAEDNRLGWALAQAGRTVQLSVHAVTLLSDAMHWREYWRHQRRVGRDLPSGEPGRFAASILTHGLSLVTVLAPFLGIMHPLAAWSLVGSVWFVRWLTVRQTARILSFPMPNLATVVFIGSLVETLCWGPRVVLAQSVVGWGMVVRLSRGKTEPFLNQRPEEISRSISRRRCRALTACCVSGKNATISCKSSRARAASCSCVQ
jgi:hypothetical protein